MVNFETAVGVAQLVERRSVAPNVAGSIPVSHPNSPDSQTDSPNKLPAAFSMARSRSFHPKSLDGPPFAQILVGILGALINAEL